ncbi:hypothetical protein D6L37_16415 [Vibrio parahaemolyticus]|nr:hypothetical protein [Vibrio parahaemolyticus]
MLSILINVITMIAIVSTAIFCIWTIIDTKRKYSMNEFNESRQARSTKAKEHFKDKTRLGK